MKLTHKQMFPICDYENNPDEFIKKVEEALKILVGNVIKIEDERDGVDEIRSGQIKMWEVLEASYSTSCDPRWIDVSLTLKYLENDAVIRMIRPIIRVWAMPIKVIGKKIEVEILTYDEINEIALHDGLLVRYPNWKWDMKYETGNG